MQVRAKEQVASDSERKLQRSLREVKEELAQVRSKESENLQKKKELEQRFIFSFSSLSNVVMVTINIKKPELLFKG